MAIDLAGYTPIGFGKACVKNELIDGDDILLDEKELKIYPILSTSHPTDLASVLKKDLHLQGLNVGAWVINRGRKIMREYRSRDDILVASIQYTYEFNEESNRLANVIKHIHYYGIDDSVVMIKDISKGYSVAKIASLGRQIRQNQIDHLEGFADIVVPAFRPYIAQLFTHYADVIRSYVEYASNDFLNAIENETDPTIQAVFSQIARQANTDGWQLPFDLTVFDAIRYELTGEYPTS